MLTRHGHDSSIAHVNPVWEKRCHRTRNKHNNFYHLSAKSDLSLCFPLLELWTWTGNGGNLRFPEILTKLGEFLGESLSG